MLRKRNFRHFWWANTSNWLRYPYDHIIKRMKARVPCRQTGSEHSEHCAAYDLKRSCRPRNDGKRTVWVIKRKITGSRIFWIERPQSQESEYRMQRQQLCKSRNIWGMLKRHDQQPQSLKQHLRRCWMLLETVWAIVQVPKMRWMGKTRMMMQKIQSLASWAKMMNLAGWWAQSPKWYSTAWWAFGWSRWGLRNWCNLDGGTRPTASVRDIWRTGWLNWRFRQLWSPTQTRQQPHHHRQHLDSLCRWLISSLDNHKCWKWRLDREVVKYGWVLRNLRQTITYYLSCQTRCPIRQRWRLQRQFNLWSVTPAYGVTSWLPYRYQFRKKTSWRLLRHRRNR